MFDKMNISLQSLRRSLLWVVIAFAAIAGQLGLSVHQLEHSSHPDIAAIAEDCIACQFSAEIIGGPTSSAGPTLLGVELGSITPQGQEILQQEELLTGFQSRAPPPPVSV